MYSNSLTQHFVVSAEEWTNIKAIIEYIRDIKYFNLSRLSNFRKKNSRRLLNGMENITDGIIVGYYEVLLIKLLSTESFVFLDIFKNNSAFLIRVYCLDSTDYAHRHCGYEYKFICLYKSVLS